MSFRSPGFAPELLRSLLWQREDRAGLERFELFSSRSGWLLRGTILVMEDAAPAEIKYQIACDSGWRTQSAEISLSIGGTYKELNLKTENGAWYENGSLNQTVSGAIDIDLAWSPSTNTLPIRRLKLRTGQRSGLLTAAWVVFPDLELRRLDQEYKYVGGQRYSYASHQGSFRAELLVDRDGLILSYPNLWHRVDRAQPFEAQEE